MSQHDFVVDDASGAVVRADINAALQALASDNAGTSAPSTTYANMRWLDTTDHLLKQRNEANSAWIVRGRSDAEGLVAKSSGFTVALRDFGKIFDCTAALTAAVTAVATLGDGFWFGIRNSHASGDVIIDPNSSEQIDGATTKTLKAGESVMVFCDGSKLRTLGLPPDMTGDSGSGGRRGLVPAPGSGDAAAKKYLKADGTWAVAGAVAGTPCVKNPFAATSVTTQAHGLAGIPKFIRVVLKNVNTEGGYSTGDEIDLSATVIQRTSGSAGGVQIFADATNVTIICGATFTILNKSTAAELVITAANWQVIATPYYWA